MNLGLIELEKVCLSQIWNIRAFVNTLNAEYTYSGRNMNILTQQVQTPLSLKQKTFSRFFIAFLKSTWNGEHFQKKGESFSLSISEIIESKRGG